ncbi:prophage MuSo2 protein [Roseibium sp. TrichSKD4]|uniref:phage virion morphogenesis protein n=1 Tax=Roseibium sp. TrichSKD4 TaxID=744980 RepID=UPI0001E56CA5|nr:phage virion morphogenesis protein [Roseibium sp. TrichSKD4]EFO33221.1 prophage MuSo2 protein [Roseibium sp. TrichSKD4]
MAGIGVEIDIPREEMRAALKKFTTLDPAYLLDPIGALVTSQVQRRIDTEKTSPDGDAWKDNSEGTETLVRSGALVDSIDHEVDGDAAVVGSSLVYAGIHQFGGTIVPKDAEALVFRIGGRTIRAKKVEIPARPYLGLSAANRAEIDGLVGTLLRNLIE